MGVGMGSQIFGGVGPPSLKMGAHATHKCYHDKFDRSRSNGWCVLVIAKISRKV